MNKTDFLSKKQYFKDRQILYEKMKSVTRDPGRIVEIEGKYWEEYPEEDATHVFIWFDRKPMICNYSADHKSYSVGGKQFHVSNPGKKTNRVIAFVHEYNEE